MSKQTKSPFVFACITPHGGEVVPELAPDRLGLMAKTRAQMAKLGESMAAAKPDVIIVITPHGIRLDGVVAVSDSERMFGEIDEGGPSYTMERQVERTLARSIAAAAKQRQLAVTTVNFCVDAGPASCLPLDWGVIVPLYFMPPCPIVAITPSRALPMQQQVEFGQAIAAAVRGFDGRVGLIASCDWAHRHHEQSPYGYHEAAKRFDEQMLQRVREDRLEALADFDPGFIDDARPDGIWQALMLAGAMPPEERKVTILSYEVPTYFGLLCAAVEPR